MYAHLRTHAWTIDRLGRSPQNEHRVDLAEAVPELPGYDYVVHNAGWAHRVPRTEAEAERFWQVNREGTAHLLAAFAEKVPRAMVLVSTVAVYGREQGEGVAETTPIQADTPYAASKHAAEQLWTDWAQARAVDYLVLRLPLVVGPDPPGNLGAMAKAIQAGYYPIIQGNAARKSVVRADDVATLIGRWLRQDDRPSGIYNLTDGVDPTFNAIAHALAGGLHTTVRVQVPDRLLRAIGRVGDIAARLSLPAPFTTDTHTKMTQTLTFDDTKARRELDWQPRPALDLLREGVTG